jgi:hypothetical protein
MGRYLSGGLISEFKVLGENCNLKDKNVKKELLQCLGKMINLDFFDMEQLENGFYFKLKEEPIKEYFVDYIKELNTFDDDAISEVLYQLYGNNRRDKTIDDIAGKIKLISYDDFGHDEYVLAVEDSENFIDAWDNPFFPHERIFLEGFSKVRDVRMVIDYFVTSRDYDKYDGEDEGYVCRLLNRMVRKAMTNPLKDITFFTILG